MRSTFAKNNSFPAAPDAWERTKPPSVAECAVCVSVCSAGDDGEPHHLHLDFIHIEKQRLSDYQKQLNSSFLLNRGYCKWAKHLVAT